MSPVEFLQKFMPGDVVLTLRESEEKDQIVIVFASGYEFISGTGWKWRASEELKAEESARWERDHPGEKRPIQ